MRAKKTAAPPLSVQIDAKTIEKLRSLHRALNATRAQAAAAIKKTEAVEADLRLVLVETLQDRNLPEDWVIHLDTGVAEPPPPPRTAAPQP